MGTFQEILRKLPQKPVFQLHNHEEAAVQLKTEEESNSIERIHSSNKEHQIHKSTDVVTWALLEAIEMTKE
jgi:hypothetical protein